MKKLITLAAVFGVLACLLAGCRSGNDGDTTTTGNSHTLPQTTGATITTPMETTTRPTETTRPSTTPSTGEGTMPSGTDGNGSATTPGGNTQPGGSTTMPGTRGRGRGIMPGQY